MGGEFLLFSSMISDIDTFAQKLEHFLYKIYKNRERSFPEHRHLVLREGNIWVDALVV